MLFYFGETIQNTYLYIKNVLNLWIIFNSSSQDVYIAKSGIWSEEEEP